MKKVKIKKLDLDKAPIFLLVEASSDESAEDLFLSLSKQYDPRSNDTEWGDTEWGPLYQIGPKFKFKGRTFYQIQTYAGSLACFMMINVRKKKFLRSILMSNGINTNFDLIEPSGKHKSVRRSCLVKKE